MASIGWGKPRIFIKRIDTEGGTWKEVPTPVQDSTSLETTKGEKMEAKLEGGTNEDVLYKASTYALSYQIRKAKGKTQPFVSNDGIVEGEWACAVQPQDPLVPGIMIHRSVVSADDRYNSQDGFSAVYTHDALQPESGNQVTNGVIKVTESEGVISNVEVEG